jgi:hypothetical protein
MTDILRCVSCSASKIADSGVSIRIPKKSSTGVVLKWIIISGSHLQRHHKLDTKLCDFLATCQGGTKRNLYAVELKSMPAHSRRITVQLQGGADIFSLQTLEGNFVAILVHARGLSANERKVLSRCRVKFKGKKYPIVPLRSSTELPLV